MRDPFILPSGCDPLAFAIPIAPLELPVCSLPPFTTPTLVLPDFALSLPFAPPPWNCPTNPTFLTHDFAPPNVAVRQLRVSIKVVPFTTDMCEPTYKISLDTSLPCLPLSVDAALNLKIVGPGAGAARAVGTMLPGLSGCMLELALGLDIPCIAFNTTLSKSLVMLPVGTPPYITGGVSRKVTGSGPSLECELAFKLEIGIPDFGCPITVKDDGSSSDSGKVVIIPISHDKPPSGRFGLTIDEECAISFSLELSLPEVGCPVTIQDDGSSSSEGNVVITPISKDKTPSGRFDMAIDENCAISFSLELSLPEPGCPVTVGGGSSDGSDGNVVITPISSDKPPSGRLEIGIDDNCEITFALELSLPEPGCPVTIGGGSGGSEGATVIINPVPPGTPPTGSADIAISPDCEISLVLTLNLPDVTCVVGRVVTNVAWSGGSLIQTVRTTNEYCEVTIADETILTGVECEDSSSS